MKVDYERTPTGIGEILARALVGREIFMYYGPRYNILELMVRELMFGRELEVLALCVVNPDDFEEWSNIWGE